MNLAEALPKEIERIQKLIKEYEDPILNGSGRFAAALMRMDIEVANKAIVEGDVVKMIIAYKELHCYE